MKYIMYRGASRQFSGGMGIYYDSCKISTKYGQVLDICMKTHPSAGLSSQKWSQILKSLILDSTVNLKSLGKYQKCPHSNIKTVPILGNHLSDIYLVILWSKVILVLGYWPIFIITNSEARYWSMTTIGKLLKVCERFIIMIMNVIPKAF